MTTFNDVTSLVAATLPSGFKARNDGIWAEITKVGEDPQWVRICSPLSVLALTRDGSGTAWGRLVEVVDPDGNRHQRAIPSRMLAGDGVELRALLLDMGLSIEPGNVARNSLMALLQQWQPAKRVLSSKCLGWPDDTFSSFLLGDGRVIGTDHVVFQGEGVPTTATEMKTAGTLAEWTQHVAKPSVGNALMILAISHAFTGPLLQPMGLDGGGFHLRGESSRGKSTIQRVAVSVWGSPKLLHSWRATSNGLEGVASVCNGTLLALDEMSEITGREAGAAAYMLANGVGKARANQKGFARDAQRWRVPMLSSGEISLADKIAEGGGRAAAGQEVRLLDILADDRIHGAFDMLHGLRDGAAFAGVLRRATAQYYGAAGPAFVAELLDDLAAASDVARRAVTGFREQAFEEIDAAADGQIERAIERFGLAAAAGELATKFGLTGWEPGTARDAAMACFQRWLDSRGGPGALEARHAVERVRAFVTANGDARFEPLPGEGHDRVVIDRAGWRDDTAFYIAIDTWKAIHAGSDASRAARHLRDAGYLQPGDGKNLAAKAPRTVPNRPRVYVVLRSIMGAGDD